MKIECEFKMLKTLATVFEKRERISTQTHVLIENQYGITKSLNDFLGRLRSFFSIFELKTKKIIIYLKNKKKIVKINDNIY